MVRVEATKDDLRAGRQSLHRFLFDGFLLLVSFAAVHLIKRGDLRLDPRTLSFLPLLFGSWLVSTALTWKFRRLDNERRLVRRTEPFVSAVLFQGGMMAIAIYSLTWVSLSRVIVFGTLAVFLLLEIVFLSGNYISIFRSEQMRIKKDFSLAFMLLEVGVMAAVILFVGVIKTQSLRDVGEYRQLMEMLLLLWLFTGLMVHRFKIPDYPNYLVVVYPYVKSMFIVLSITSFFVFGFRFVASSRTIILGSLGVFFLFEMTIITIHYHVRAARRERRGSNDDAFTYPEEQLIGRLVEAERNGAAVVTQPSLFKSKFIDEKLKTIYLHNEPRLYQFLSRSIDLSTYDILKTVVINSCAPVNIAALPAQSFELLINQNSMNHFGSTNDYLRRISERLLPNGIFVSCFEPNELRRSYYKKHYPFILSRLLFAFTFFYKRVLPTLPLLQTIYASITHGQYHVLSLAEGLGRLSFCGFDIVALEVIDANLYFIVRKSDRPVPAANPIYRLVFKQRRVGKDRRLFHAYKIRTMYSYSEYLHRYVIEKNKLNEIGKVKDDFRITRIGRILRKLWIDELPMLVNLVKGDISLVGVRPLSETFFNLYPPELQRRRTRFRPGLIPPYYADMPRTIEDIWASEDRYLARCEQKPFRTAVVYFFRAMNNILFHHAKSG